MASIVSSGPVARRDLTSPSCQNHAGGWPADEKRSVCAVWSKIPTNSDTNSSIRLADHIVRLSSSKACAGSRYCRRNTRSRYFTWNAVIDGSMP